MNDELYVTPIFDDEGRQVAAWVYAMKNGFYAEAICSPEQSKGDALDRLVDELLVPEMVLESRRADLARLEERARTRRREAGLAGAVSSGSVGAKRTSLARLFGPNGSAATSEHVSNRSGGSGERPRRRSSRSVSH